MLCNAISIHALLAESDNCMSLDGDAMPKFLSTLSLRRATWPLCSKSGRIPYFYPRSPCGERPDIGLVKSDHLQISIHALLAESDRPHGGAVRGSRKFLSTLSLRRATMALSAMRTGAMYFYPRSPCGERHKRSCNSFGTLHHFYPRSPCGERL